MLKVLNSRWTHNQQVVQHWANHMRNNVQKGGAESIKRGQCQLFCVNLHYDIVISSWCQRYSRMGGVFTVHSLDTRINFLGFGVKQDFVGIIWGLIRRYMLYWFCWKHCKYMYKEIFSGFMGNNSECGTIKSPKNCFAVHVICLFCDPKSFSMNQEKKLLIT